MLHHASLTGRTLFFLLILTVSLSCARLSRADALPGLESTSQVPKGNILPPEVEAVLTALLQAAVAGGRVPDAAQLAPLLQYVRSDIAPAKVRLEKRDHGSGAFALTTLRVPLQRVVRYFFDPNIPGEAVFPNSLRRHYWLPGSPILTRSTPLWKQLDNLTPSSAPIAVRGTEYEEITPDTFSGSYYNYTLDRLVVLLQFQDCNTVISVTRQRGPSGVGRKGAILGNDNNWDYLYSKKEGSNLKLAGWASTYLYDSANVTLFYEPTPGAKTTSMALFKYLRAGWANMNMVKPSHIASGIKRFLDGLRQVLESPRLPGAEIISKRMRQLENMDADALRTALAPYNSVLNSWTGADSLLSSSDFKALLDSDTYTMQLTPQEMRSELIKQFMKQQLGKPPLAAPTGREH